MQIRDKKIVRQRPYWVVVADGNGSKEFEATNRYAYNEGIIYEYKDEKGQLDLVAVPHGYKYLKEDGRILIGKNLGNSSAASMIQIGKSADPECPGSDLSLLIRTHVASMGWKTVNEKAMPWKMLVIGIAVLVVVIGVVWFIRSQGA